jgi:hypothetical protein
VGVFLYGASSMVIEFDDRTLAHLRAVIGAKLGRGEGFFLSWTDDRSLGTGRSSIWLDTSIPIAFQFDSSKPIEANRDWLDVLTRAANLPEGLHFVGETGGTRRLARSRVLFV